MTEFPESLSVERVHPSAGAPGVSDTSFDVRVTFRVDNLGELRNLFAHLGVGWQA